MSVARLERVCVENSRDKKGSVALSCVSIFTHVDPSMIWSSIMIIHTCIAGLMTQDYNTATAAYSHSRADYRRSGISLLWQWHYSMSRMMKWIQIILCQIKSWWNFRSGKLTWQLGPNRPTFSIKWMWIRVKIILNHWNSAFLLITRLFTILTIAYCTNYE